MSKERKNVKRISHLKYVSEGKLNKLYKLYPSCRDCKFGCIGQFDGIKCINKEVEYTLNEIIEMIKDSNIDLVCFTEKYNLKLGMLLEMLKGNMPMKYSYYVAIMQRLHNPDYSALEREFLSSELVKERKELVYG